MAIITISQQVGSSDHKIATQLAERLNFTLIDKKKIEELASEYLCDDGYGIHSITNENKPDFFSEFTITKPFYNHLICSVIYDAASRDNVVIKGRGANFLLFGHPNVFCVRIIAPFAQRVTTIHKKYLDINKAEKFVNKATLDQKKFIRFFHNQEISNPDYYDLIINTGKIDSNEILQILLNKINSLGPQYFMGAKERERLQNLSIENRIKAMFIKKKCNFSNWSNQNMGVRVDGCVTLSGIVNSDKQKAIIEGCANLVAIDKMINNEIVVISATY